jgi:hypothetical protein
MRVSKRILILVVACLSSLCLPNPAIAQDESDQVIAERVLGPQWKQLSRRAGMVFAGTVLTPATQSAAGDQTVSRAMPSVQFTLRVDHAISGVEPGRILTIHEWSGSSSMHRPMPRGEHILIFLFPPSRLGLTSPVGGALGQFELDPSGTRVFGRKRSSGETGTVSVIQLERAIRSAREE